MSTSDTIRLHNPQNRCHENREKRERRRRGDLFPSSQIFHFSSWISRWFKDRSSFIGGSDNKVGGFYSQKSSFLKVLFWWSKLSKLPELPLSRPVFRRPTAQHRLRNFSDFKKKKIHPLDLKVLKKQAYIQWWMNKPRKNQSPRVSFLHSFIDWLIDIYLVDSTKDRYWKQERNDFNMIQIIIMLILI